MEKKPTSVNMRVDHREWADENNVNISSLFNDLLDEYRFGRSYAEDAATEYMIQELDLKIRTKETEVESLQKQKERIEERRDETPSEVQEAIDECLELFSYLPDSADDPAVQSKARNAGVTPERFYEELTEAWDDA